MMPDGTMSDSHSYYGDEQINKYGNDLNLIKNAINDFRNSRIVFDSENFMSDEYYIADITMSYGEETYYGRYKLSGSYYILVPKESPLLSELNWDNYYEEEYDENLDGGYDIEVEPEKESNIDFQVN